MAQANINLEKLDEIIQKTIRTIYKSKDDLNHIADDARCLCDQIETEYFKLKDKVSSLIDEISTIEDRVNDSKILIDNISKNSITVSPQEIQETLQKANEIRTLLVLKRNEEQLVIKKRNELEIQLKETLKTLGKAETVIENISFSLNALTENLMEISEHIQDIRISQQIGLKIIQAQEDERRRVAMEIHDGPAQMMSNLVVKTEICHKLMDVNPSKVKSELAKLKKSMQDCLSDVKQIVYDLRPLSLEENGLAHTLKKLVDDFIHDSSIETTFKMSDFDECCVKEVSLTVFRIPQECLSNIKKHAQATYVQIAFDIFEQSIHLSVKDNGRGLDIKAAKEGSLKPNSGFGLISMGERIKLLNGSFEIESALNTGTKIEVKLPIMTAIKA